MGVRIILVIALIGTAGLVLLPAQWEAFLFFALGLVGAFAAAWLGKRLARRKRR